MPTKIELEKENRDLKRKLEEKVEELDTDDQTA